MFYQKLKTNFFGFAMTNITAMFFIAILLVSFSWHVSHRNQHFQECDSASVYQSMRDFPKSALANSVPVPGNANFLSKETVQKILSIKLVNNLRTKYFSNISDEEITQKLTSLKPAPLARLVVRTFLLSLDLPHFIQTGLAIPFSSTYSFGSGIAYGLVTHRDMSYEDFMSNTLIVTQILFHISVVILFITLILLGVSQWTALFIALLMLFSISMYSYGYHLGNTVWNYSTSFLWVWVLVYYWRDGGKDILKKISLATGILIFFNYLIILYWIAFLMAYVYLHWNQELGIKNQEVKSEKNYYKPLILNSKFLILVIKSQWLAILSIIFVAGLFYPPGQSNRGTTSLATFFSDVYYIVLNFFSFYNHSQIFNILQFVLGSILIIGGLVYIFRSDKFESPENSSIIILKKTFSFLILIFALLAILGVLGFAPSRHILFLSPIVFIFGAIFLDRFVLKHLDRGTSLIIFAVVLALGLTGVYLRADDVKSLAKTITIDNDVKSVVIQDCAVDLAYKDWQTAVPVDYAKPYLFTSGDTHLYLSPTVPFSQALSDWQWSGSKHPTEIQAEVLSDFFDIKDVYFTAYNPRHFYNHWPNSIHKTRFKITGVKVLK